MDLGLKKEKFAEDILTFKDFIMFEYDPSFNYLSSLGYFFELLQDGDYIRVKFGTHEISKTKPDNWEAIEQVSFKGIARCIEKDFIYAWVLVDQDNNTLGFNIT